VAEDILAFSSEHLDACARIMVMVNNRDPWNENWIIDTARARIWEIANTPGFIGIVSWNDGIAGYALGCCEQWDAYKHYCLYEIAVRPDAQRQGLGSKLLSYLELILAAHDIKKIYLSTLRSSYAEAFYLKHGYHHAKDTVTMLRYLNASDL
jgi:GNAT superfamily N-acetyltransferase